jgi:RNA polymerase sigma-70 factor (ECF subfamily)
LEPSVEQLVRKAQDGNQDAFAQLIDRFEKSALSVAFAVLSCGEEAGDAVQEAFIRAWRRLGDLREPGRFGAWLCGIVRNQAIDVQRRNRRIGRAHAHVQAEPSSRAPPDPAEELLRKEAGALVIEALGTLDGISRSVVILRYYQDLTSKQIGALLGLSATAVDMRLSRARRVLRARLLDEEPSVAFAQSRIAVENGHD